MTRRVRLIGIGSGHPDQLTIEAVRALNEVDYFILADKSGEPGRQGTGGLTQVRDEICRRHIDGDWRIVTVTDPERDRSVSATDAYDRAVANWHEARAQAYEQVLIDNPGDAGLLVWGDPAFYDSNIRIVERIHERSNIKFEYDVIPGISSIQLLAARHKIVLNPIGRPFTVTTGRRLREAADAGHDNLVVMLSSRFTALELDGQWDIWWGANLGTTDEALVSGALTDVGHQIEAKRDSIKQESGWIMDVYLLRRRQDAPDS